jgi:hypothetical protein
MICPAPNRCGAFIWYKNKVMEDSNLKCSNATKAITNEY